MPDLREASSPGMGVPTWRWPTAPLSPRARRLMVIQQPCWPWLNCTARHGTAAREVCHRRRRPRSRAERGGDPARRRVNEHSRRRHPSAAARIGSSSRARAAGPERPDGAGGPRRQILPGCHGAHRGQRPARTGTVFPILLIRAAMRLLATEGEVMVSARSAEKLGSGHHLL